MGQKTKPILLLLVLVLFIGGATALYRSLEQTLTPDQLAVQPFVTQSTEEAEKQETAAQTEPTETAQSQESTAPKGPAAPDFTAYDLEGNPVHLSDYLGKPVVLNFWASWCGPCQMEMPDFQQKYLELGEQVTFLMVNMTDGSRETLEGASEFIAEKGYTFPVFYDTQSDAAITYGVYSLPTTYFIDAQGYAVARAPGAIDAATLQRGIDMIVGE